MTAALCLLRCLLTVRRLFHSSVQLAGLAAWRHPAPHPTHGAARVAGLQPPGDSSANAAAMDAAAAAAATLPGLPAAPGMPYGARPRCLQSYGRQRQRHVTKKPERECCAVQCATWRRQAK